MRFAHRLELVMNGSAAYWHSPEGASVLEQSRRALEISSFDALRAGTVLRKQFPELSPNLIASAVELVVLRGRARSKGYGEWVEQGLFTRQSLEQATAPQIAAHHAARFAYCKHVLEICTGAGFDTAALAQAVAPNGGRVTTIEADEQLAAMAQANFAAQGIRNIDVIVGKAEDVVAHEAHQSSPLSLSLSLLVQCDGLWCDPSRRNERGQRIEHVDEYKPSLRFVQGVAAQLRQDAICGIKISPAVNLPREQMFVSVTQHWAQHWKREWIGFGGECREQVLWRLGGQDKVQDVMVRDGTVSIVDHNCVWSPPSGHGEIPEARQAQHERVENVENVADVVRVVRVVDIDALHGAWILEPHNALIRSGALAQFFAEHSCALLDEHIAYGVAFVPPAASPLYQVFAVCEAFPYNAKILKRRVHERGWGTRTEIKKRGFPEEPEAIRAALKLKESSTFGVVILTRKGNKHIAILAERVEGVVQR